MAQMSEPTDVSTEATESGSTDIDGIRLWKVVTAVDSVDDGVGLFSCVSRCGCGTDSICY